VTSKDFFCYLKEEITFLAVGRLKELTEKYPRSVLAGYAHTALGVNLCEDFANFKENKVRKANVKQSISSRECER
jgi:hypothetical protein